MDAIEDIPQLYPAPFWAAYGALEGGGVRHAQIRSDVAGRIVAALIAIAEPVALAKAERVSVRLDNVAIRDAADEIWRAYPQASWRQALDPAVYAAGRVLAVG